MSEDEDAAAITATAGGVGLGCLFIVASPIFALIALITFLLILNAINS